MSRVLPILFNTDMVRATLDGRKKVTRRIIKHDVDAILNSPYHKEHPEVEDKQIISKLCMPPYQQGDIMYVRETWYKGLNRILYKANYSENEKFYENGKEIQIKWHPSIHMPKEAARIWLKVKDVRVERLQEIDAIGCLQEGIKSEYPHVLNGEEKRYAFSQLWNSTIKKSDLDRYGWDANPWVWVIKFERCEKPDVRCE